MYKFCTVRHLEHRVSVFWQIGQIRKNWQSCQKEFRKTSLDFYFFNNTQQNSLVRMDMIHYNSTHANRLLIKNYLLK